MDSSERGAGDLGAASGSDLLPATPGLLPGCHGDAAPLPASRGGVHRPKEPQVRDEAAVGDLGVRAAHLTPRAALSSGSPSWPDMWSAHIQSFPVCDKETIEGEQRVNPPSCLMIITDALISDCDQLNDCPNLDFKDALTFSSFVLLSLYNTL